MQINRLHSCGFTLIELMITVAIIGILSAVALPFYNDYTIRTKVAAGIHLASTVKTGVSESYISNSIPGINAYAANLMQDSDLGLVAEDAVQSIAVSDTPGQSGTITITFNTAEIPALGTQNVVKLSPHINGASLDSTTESATLQWECSGETGSKAGEAFVGAQLGTIKSRFLPQSCR